MRFKASGASGFVTMFLSVPLSLGVGQFTKWGAVAAGSVCFVIGVYLAVAGHFGWVPFEADDLPLEERLLNLANQVRRCDPKSMNDTPYVFPSARGFAQTVSDHMDRQEAFLPNPLRRYTRRLDAQIKATVEEAALVHQDTKNADHWLRTPFRERDLRRLSAELWVLARRLFMTKHDIKDFKN